MAKKIGVVVDSTADFPEGVVQKLGLHVMPVYVVVEGKDYLDGVTISKEEVIAFLKEGKDVVTRPPAPAEYANFYEKLLGNYDFILSLQISSQLSDCYQSATNALNLLEDADAAKIKVIDTKNTSIGQALYTIRAIETMKNDKTIDNLETKLDMFMESSVNNFTVDSLKWLKKSGRVSTLGAMFGNMLDIKPIIAVKDSKLALVGRARGKKNALDEMAGFAGLTRKKFGGDYDVWVAHCDAIDDAGYLKRKLAAELEMDRELIAIVQAGASVSVKVGPGSCTWGMVKR